MQHELKQVEVRLKLTDKAGVFSMERIDTPEKSGFCSGTGISRT